MGLATVQRIRHERGGVACFPFVEHRTRDLRVLFVGDEWGWSEDPREAFVFLVQVVPAVSSALDHERSADAHIVDLVAKGDKHFICSCSFNESGAQVRALKRLSLLASLEASADGIPEVAAAPGGCLSRGGNGRAPLRDGDLIQARIVDARRRGAKRASKLSPYERMEKEGLA